MKCLVFDRGNGVIGIGFKIQFGGIDQFAIAWPDCPPERMTGDFLESNGVKILGESEISPPIDPPLVPVVESVDPIEPLAETVELLIELPSPPETPAPAVVSPAPEVVPVVVQPEVVATSVVPDVVVSTTETISVSNTSGSAIELV